MISETSFKPPTDSIRAGVPAGTRALIRRKQGRLRWIYKYRRARSFGRSIREDPATTLRFVFLDPEVGNFSYEVENEDALIEFLAAGIAVPSREIAGYVEEAHRDRELGSELRRRVRWRWDSKRRLPLGRRLGWYALTRALRPATIVETGIQNGLGSLALLRAIERNAEEGDAGELISFDIAKGSGWLVPDGLRRFWTPVYESTFDALDRTLAGKHVDLLISDLGAGYEVERHDYETVSRHGADLLVLVAGSAHSSNALRDFAQERNLGYSEFLERPHKHVYPGGRTGIVVLRRGRMPDGAAGVPEQR